jgi:hypothetical protein
METPMAAPRPTVEIHNAHVRATGGYSQTMITMENERGTVQLGICTTCSYIEASCECTTNTWFNQVGEAAPDGDGIVLCCNLCGADGT